ncbi:sugar transferase [uncultured Phascolarctobacterium sp.]|uniref:sugar transferase n=1 Tax=uncultured Phascolarctobacterium sp. TaxID=512296 RepID=UPI002636F5F8|nr:sugar transferase [uncultured Phascolarctobacterium sp.]
MLKLFNVFLITIPFAWGWFNYYAQHMALPFYDRGNWVVVALYAVLYMIFGRVYGGFWISLNRISESVYSQALAVMMTSGIMYVVTVLLERQLPNIWPVIAAFAVQLVLSGLWSMAAHVAYYMLFPATKTIIVYDERQGMEKLIQDYGFEKKFTVIKTLTVEKCIANIDLLHNAQTVFVSGVHSHERNIILKYCVEQGIMMYLVPRIGDVLMSGAQQMHMFHLPMLRVGRYNPSPWHTIAKRTFDVVSAGALFLVISPLMLITAIAIKTDGGPVFYKQRRLTQDGKEFDVLKFRSMRVDAEKDGVARLSTGDNDDRITKVGRFIRKVRIDELPQLLNIIGGSMSVVGPRPERPEIASQYVKEMPEFSLRLQAKAGLTGYAQVYGKYNTTPYDKLQMDLMYISNPSFWEDLRIIFATIKILFVPESTEGVAEGQKTAMK